MDQRRKAEPVSPSGRRHPSSVRLTRRLAPALLVAAGLTEASASSLFPNQVYPIDGAPVGVVAADFNGDGRLDLAAPVRDGAAGVAILLARDHGTFEQVASLGASADAFSVVAADFNGDLRADLAVAWSTTSEITIELGRGDGTFARGARLAAGALPRSLAAGDLDRDGHQDLVAALYDPGSILVLPGRGDGTFAPGTLLAAGWHPVSITLADCDGDGRLDVAVANLDSNDVSFRRGRGDGDFETEIRVAVGDGPEAVGAGDFTGDGLADLAVAIGASNRVQILAGRSDGTLETPLSIGTGELPVALAATDADGDGRDDLLVGNARSGDLTTHLATRPPPVLFGPRIASRAGEEPAGVAAGDFDGDGLSDVAVANAVSRTIAVLAGRGDGAFGDARRHHVGPDPKWIALGRLDRDRHWDAAVATSGATGIAVLLGRGDGGFQARTTFEVGGHPGSVAISEFNADQRADLAVPLTGDDRVVVLAGDGAGGFTPLGLNYTGSGPSAAASGDFDADGRVDLAVANLHSDDVSIFRGRGDMTFDSAVSVAAGDGPWSIRAADLNGDRILDLAVGDNGPISPTTWTFGLGDVAILTGRPQGGFDTGVSWPAGANPRVIAIGDFNGDHRPDIAAASLYYYVSVLLNDGGGRFSHARCDAGIRPESVATGDLDADGIVDLVVANSQSGDLSVLLGRGDGTFRPEQRYLAGLAPFSVGVADLDEDRRQDIVVANSLSDDLWVLLNEGPFPDTDGDGVTDDVDTCTDSDGDGFGDPEIPASVCPLDDCPADPDPLQGDADGDGRGDVCDPCALDPLDDADRDGVCADRDTCPDLADPGQPDGDTDGRGDLCDNCPVDANALQEDGNADGSGDACQPSLILLGVRAIGDDTLELLVQVRDPQGDPLSGVVTLFESIDHPVTLADLGSTGDCRQGLFPRGVEGEGIGFAFGSVGAPVLFDFGLGVQEFGLPCVPGANRYGIADRPGAAPGPAAFQDVLAIGHLVPTAGLCVAILDPAGLPAPGQAIDMVLRGYGPGSIDLSLSESRTRDYPFASDLPDRISLSGLVVGAGHRLSVTVTDGSTLPVTATIPFPYAGQDTLIIRRAGPPRAVITAPAALECDRLGGGLVTLDGSLSTGSDPGGALEYAWLLDPGLPTERPLGDGATLQTPLPLGSNRLGLVVTDNLGGSGASETLVLVTDTAAPVVAVSVTPGILSPANNLMVDVTALVTATDLCATPRVLLASIASNDPEDGRGDGSTTHDIEGAAFGENDFRFRLRAERSGASDRIYTITYRAVDDAGNAATASVAVVVPSTPGPAVRSAPRERPVPRSVSPDRPVVRRPPSP